MGGLPATGRTSQQVSFWLVGRVFADRINAPKGMFLNSKMYKENVKRYWPIIVFMIGGLLVNSYCTRPTYEIKVYKLGFYPYTYLTQMIYSSPMRRELLYIYGDHQTETYPDKDYIMLDDFSGFDSVSEVIADCDSSQNIIIYSTAGPEVYKNPTGSKKMISRQVDNGTYMEMRENQAGKYIVAN